MRRRGFNGEADLAACQEIVADRTREMGPCTNLHPGDIAHRVYSGLRGRDISQFVPVWEEGGLIVAFGVVWPGDHSFDVVVRPGLDMHLISQVVENLADLAGGDAPVATEVIGDDVETIALLTKLGFAAGSADYVFTQAPLGRPVPVEPHGYTIRSVSLADTEQLAAVHSGAFGSGWSATDYGRRMREPGYDPDDEIVAVDEAGTFMGFAVTWYDGRNKVGYFEPVGVHPRFHRHGIGTALLSAGKERMRRAGMDTATVWHGADDERADAFYRSNGFMVVNPITRWVRG